MTLFLRILTEPGRFMVLFPVFKENDIDPVMLSLNTFVSATFCIKASLSNASLFSFFATWFVVVVLFTVTAVLLSFTSCFFAPQALSNNTTENIVIAFNCSCLRCLLFIPFIVFTFLFLFISCVIWILLHLFLWLFPLQKCPSCYSFIYFFSLIFC